MMPKQNDSFGWVKDASTPRKRSLWDRIVRRDDDDDGPGPNAGASLWPTLSRPLFDVAS